MGYFNWSCWSLDGGATVAGARRQRNVGPLCYRAHGGDPWGASHARPLFGSTLYTFCGTYAGWSLESVCHVSQSVTTKTAQVELKSGRVAASPWSWWGPPPWPHTHTASWLFARSVPEPSVIIYDVRLNLPLRCY
jgi:hypothetical protein